MSTSPVGTAPASWAFPPLDEVNFSKNCTAYANFAHSWNDDDNMSRGSVGAIIDYFYGALSERQRNESITAGMIIDWFMRAKGQGSTVSSDFSLYALEIPFRTCSRETCEAMKWNGNADISGVGMVASYCIELILLTIMIAALAIKEYRDRPVRTPPILRNPFVKRLVNAFCHSSSEFFLNGTLLAISVSVAWLVARYKADKSEDVPDQELLLGILASMLSDFPIFALAALVPNLRPEGVFALVLLLFLVVADSILIYKHNVNTRPRWERMCIPESISVWLRAPRAIWGLSVGLSLVVATLWYLASRKKKGNERRPDFNMVRWGLGCFYLVMAWATFGAFIFNRQRYIDISGGSNQEREWSFGQVLALFAWLEIVILILVAFKNNSGPDPSEKGPQSHANDASKPNKQAAESKQSLLRPTERAP